MAGFNSFFGNGVVLYFAESTGQKILGHCRINRTELHIPRKQTKTRKGPLQV